MMCSKFMFKISMVQRSLVYYGRHFIKVQKNYMIHTFYINSNVSFK